MSHYTTQVRWIVEYYTPNFQGSITQRIQAAAPSIFDFNFPLWKNDYRLELETKILRHYYTKEIGLETVELWKLFLEERLNFIMPYYNKLYKAIDEEWNWKIDYDVWEKFMSSDNDVNQFYRTSKVDVADKLTGEGNVRGEQSQDTDSTVTGSEKINDVNSDYPQASYQQGIDYASTSQTTDTNNQEKSVGNVTATNENTMTNTSDRSINTLTDQHDHTEIERGREHMMHRAGLNGSRSMSELFQQYRDTLMDVDVQIINDLHDLFMEVY